MRTCRSSSACSRRRLCGLGAGDEGHQLGSTGFRGPPMTDNAAGAHDPHCVGEPHHLIEIVADKQKCAAVSFQLRHEIFDLRPFAHAQRGRGFVHDGETGVPAERAAHRHRLALSARQPPNPRLDGRDVDLQSAQHLTRPFGHGALARETERTAPGQLPAEEKVLPDRKVVDERQVLKERLDAMSPRLVRIVQTTGFPSNKSAPDVG